MARCKLKEIERIYPSARTSVCDGAVLIQLLARVRDPMYGFSRCPQPAGALGLGEQVEAREYLPPVSTRVSKP